MRYLKIFEKFDNSNVKDDIRDIFVELIDKGYKINFKPNVLNTDELFVNNFKTGNFSICLYMDMDSKVGIIPFKISDVNENILMLIDFVKEKGINSDVSFHITTRNKRDMNYIKKLSLNNLDKFSKENRDINFIEIIFESKSVNEKFDEDGKFTIDDKFKQDIKDMFVELEDIDFTVTIDYLDKGKDIQDIMVLIEKKDESLFNSNDVKEYLLMLLDYSKDYYKVIGHKFAIYKTVKANNIWSVDTQYHNEFPDDQNYLECMGIDILMESKR